MPAKDEQNQIVEQTTSSTQKQLYCPVECTRCDKLKNQELAIETDLKEKEKPKVVELHQKQIIITSHDE